MAYLLDANVFIAAKNLHYGLDFCPAFWDWLIDRNQAGIVYSIEKVADEIEAGADEQECLCHSSCASAIARSLADTESPPRESPPFGQT